jgi:hypothetical protein
MINRVEVLLWNSKKSMLRSAYVRACSLLLTAFDDRVPPPPPQVEARGLDVDARLLDRVYPWGRRFMRPGRERGKCLGTVVILRASILTKRRVSCQREQSVETRK